MNISLLKYKRKALSLLLSIAVVCLLVPFSLQAASPALQIQEEGIFTQAGNGMMWQMDRSKRLKTTQDVEVYLATLNSGKYNNWRLPTQQELFELFSLFDLKENGDVKIQLEGGYWLVGKNTEVEAGTWEIGDGCGPSRKYYTKKAGYVRAVRP